MDMRDLSCSFSSDRGGKDNRAALSCATISIAATGQTGTPPFSEAHATTPTHAPTPRQPSKADKELLFKGVTCALIGLVIVLAPYIARSGDVRELMGQVAAVGWFALVLGGAFIVQYVVRRVRAGAHRQ